MLSITEAFAKSLSSYLNYIQMPWGSLFYHSAWRQIENHFTSEKKQTILDIGCGFGITSHEFAKRGYTVTGIDPTSEMIAIAQDSALKEGLNIAYITNILQDTDLLADSYDWIFCHNVLEYLDHSKEMLMAISEKQSVNGMLSLIAHNPVAKVMKKAIINKDPQGALDSIGNTQEYSGVIQTDISIYTKDQLVEWLADCGYEVRSTYGIHNIYGYIADNEIKMDEDWNEQMVELELKLSCVSPYKDIAIFTHLIAEKSS
ncbi:methyltransferase domain-containing protein [Paenibacillus sp.]|uniref:methyltransferase domain-containing protein n=1 Tax=Paenibacillus sp. TaxID=58172 RepID=UPI0028AD5FC4|nr:methyltransferase domain-containing protein [Paenibacillus sp.]